MAAFASWGKASIAAASSGLQGPSVHRDGHVCLIVTKALQHGLQAIDVLLRTPHESEGTDRRCAPQRFELRAVLERGVERLVSSGRDRDRVGLRVCRV
jgi:hypothetical protein